AMVSVLFSLATLGVLVSGIALLRGKTAGQMAGLVLAATLFFWKETAAEYADLPVGFFLLSAVALLGLAGAFAAEHLNLLLLAGFAAGVGAWTKNEGLLMLLAVGLGWLVATRKLSEVVPLLIGAAPPGAVVALFKLTLAPPNDLVARNDPASALQRLSQWTRLAEVAAALARELVRFGDFALNPLLLLASCALLLGWEWRHRAGLVTGALALGLTLGGYLLALLLSPAALGWQLDTALSRLLLQLWPCAVLTCFLGLKPLAVAAPPAPVKKIRRK
ncbi:MAG: hypothetical protein HYR60_15945, partial [Acidobacteria bacterium]|nr:hypothetical protein [Acidobacteriota bacterium]